MFKRLNKRVKRIILLGALFGLIRSLFFFKKEVSGKTANDLFQGIMNTLEENKPTENIFKGDAMVENIYQKALEGQKRETAKITNSSLENLQFITNGTAIEKKDLLNVLYNSNNNVAAGMDLLCNKTCKVSTKDINQSYQTIIKELNIKGIMQNTNDNAVTRNFVNNWVNSQFVIASTHQTTLEQFNKATMGEDVFMNGVADDGDYDLQIDIENIGNLLFESFIAPTETIFYKLPTSRKGSTTNQGNTTNTNENQEVIDVLQNLLTSSTSSGGINTGIITNGGAKPATQIGTKTNTTNTSTNKQTTNETEIADKSLQDFVKKASLNQKKSPTQGGGIEGDICREGVSAGSLPTTENETQTDPKELDAYIKSVQDQITKNNTLYPENQVIPNINNNPALEGMTTGQANQFLEEYVKDLFNNESRASCLKSCNSLSKTDKAVCQIQCLCFTKARPNEKDPRVQSMNEMLKLRFCMIPAKSMTIPKGKNIYSLDDILTRIQSNFEDTINGGEMVKYQKTKEYLDNPIADFSFSKLISFQININMKPIFNNKSEMAKKDQQKSDIKKIEENNGTEQNPGLNKNKYIVMADPIKDKVYQEYASSNEEYNQKYNQELAKIQSNSNTAKTKTVLDQKKPVIGDMIGEFLQENFKFRELTEKELININNITYMLRNSF